VIRYWRRYVFCAGAGGELSPTTACSSRGHASTELSNMFRFLNLAGMRASGSHVFSRDLGRSPIISLRNPGSRRSENCSLGSGSFRWIFSYSTRSGGRSQMPSSKSFISIEFEGKSTKFRIPVSMELWKFMDAVLISKFFTEPVL
jgi:hypothetical protein